MQPYERLEVEYAKHTKVDHACVTNTGTAALHLAIEALELPYDTEIIVPQFTMYASGLAVYYARLKPIFIDCDENLLINLDEVEKWCAKSPKTRVLMVTHVYGRLVDMDRVMDIAQKYDLRVIEDACEAQGATWYGDPIGSFDIGCFSFYRNKIIHAEEGGIITSNDKELIEKARDMRSMSFGETHDYYHKRIGFNYRCTNSQAEMALKSLEHVEYNLAARKNICGIWNKKVPVIYRRPDNRESVWVYDMRHKNADAVVKRLKELDIPARHSFKPLSLQPLFKSAGWRSSEMAAKMSQEVFYVNVHPKQFANIYDMIKTTVEVMDEL